MDKLPKNVLEYIRTHEMNIKYANAFITGLDQELSRHFNIGIEEFERCISYLCGEGYLQHTFIEETVTGFIITYKGMHYKEFEKARKKEFISNSIITPIVVTILTNIAIFLSGWLLSLIQELLQ